MLYTTSRYVARLAFFVTEISPNSLKPVYTIRLPRVCTSNAAAQATAHWNTTTHTAHRVPSSLFTEVMAATHGVYNRQKVKSEAAAR